MEALEVGTSELSRLLDQQGISISRQVLDNWIRMEGERIPIGVGNIALVRAFASALRYEDEATFLQSLGYELGANEPASSHLAPIIARLREYDPDNAEPIAIILTQILERWDDIDRLMSEHQRKQDS